MDRRASLLSDALFFAEFATEALTQRNHLVKLRERRQPISVLEREVDDRELNSNKVPPNNIDAERSVLGAMMLADSGEAIAAVSQILHAYDFYREGHKLLYAAILAVYSTGTPVDLVTITNYLKKSGGLEKAGGVPYIDEMINSVPSAENVDHYAKIVKDCSLQRRVIRLGAKIYHAGFEDGDAGDLVARAERAILKLRMADTESLSPIKDAVAPTIQHLEQVYQRKSPIIGLSTGVKDLDKVTSGYINGNMIVIAGRPSMGKSALVQQCIQELSVNQGIPTLLFSAEMSKEAVTTRLLSAESSIDMQQLRTGRFGESQWQTLVKAAGVISDAPIVIDDTANISLQEIRAKTHQAVSRYGVKLVAVDYIQLLRDGGHERREAEVSAISRGLKDIGRSLKLPMVVLSQLNRGAEARKDNRPMLSDLRETGAIEQDADLVILMYRKGYYDKESTDNTTELIVAKQRNGPTCVVKALFDRAHMRFRPLAEYHGKPN